jgi:dipeptide/tripeptide permease
MTLTDARVLGLVLAVFGVVFAVLYVKARSVDERIKASVLFLVWLLVAIGFAIWWLIRGPSLV